MQGKTLTISLILQNKYFLLNFYIFFCYFTLIYFKRLPKKDINENIIIYFYTCTNSDSTHV